MLPHCLYCPVTYYVIVCIVLLYVMSLFVLYCYMLCHCLYCTVICYVIVCIVMLYVTSLFVLSCYMLCHCLYCPCYMLCHCLYCPVMLCHCLYCPVICQSLFVLSCYLLRHCLYCPVTYYVIVCIVLLYVTSLFVLSCYMLRHCLYCPVICYVIVCKLEPRNEGPGQLRRHRSDGSSGARKRPQRNPARQRGRSRHRRCGSRRGQPDLGKRRRRRRADRPLRCAAGEPHSGEPHRHGCHGDAPDPERGLRRDRPRRRFQHDRRHGGRRRQSSLR